MVALTKFSLTKISCYTVEKYGIHWTSSSHKLDVGSNFNANATCRKFAWNRCTPLGSCKDQVLGNRHRPAVYASSWAATFSVGSIWPVTLPKPSMTQSKKLYNLNWGVSTLTCYPCVGRAVLRTSCFERALSVALLCRIPPPYWALSYLRWWARCTRPNRLDQWHPSQCHCYDPISLVAWFAVAATLTILPDTSVSSRLECLLLTQPLDDRPLRNCTQSPSLSTRRFFSWKVRHSEAPLHAREVLTWIYHTRSYWYTTHRLRHIQEVLLNGTSNMLKRCTVRTWRNIVFFFFLPVYILQGWPDS